MVPLYTAIAVGEPRTIFGDGEQSRDFTYVANVMTQPPGGGASSRREGIKWGAPEVNARGADGRILGKPVRGWRVGRSGVGE